MFRVSTSSATGSARNEPSGFRLTVQMKKQFRGVPFLVLIWPPLRTVWPFWIAAQSVA